MNPVSIIPVAFVETERKEPLDDFWGDTVSRILIDPQTCQPDCTQGLSAFSHLEIVYLFHLVAPTDVITSAGHPRERMDWPKSGIFAQRKKNRPNRLGVSVCRLLKVEGMTITVQGLDAIDGTPVIDIKPYVKQFAPRGPVRQPDWATELMRDYFGSEKDREGVYQKARELLRGESSVDGGLRLLTENAQGKPSDGKAWFELAGAFDGLGRESEALPFYRKALAAGFEGLPPEDRPRLFLQLGSTLRNLREFDESLRVLALGISHFPECSALYAFAGLTFFSAGRFPEAAERFAQAVVLSSSDDSCRDYRRALGYYVENIRNYP